MAKKTKSKGGLTLDVSIVSAGIRELKLGEDGKTEVQAGGLYVEFKKPRSSKYGSQLLPFSKVAAVAGDRVLVFATDEEFETFTGEISESEIPGFVTVTDSDGNEVQVNTAFAAMSGEVGGDADEKPSKKAEKPAKGKKAKDEEEDEDEDKPKKSKKDKGGKDKAKSKKKGKDEDEEEEW